MPKPSKPSSNEPATYASVLADITKTYGKGSIVDMSSKVGTAHPFIPTGLYQIDNYVLNGGIPKGRITEIYGAASGGKSTLCQTIIGEAQALGMKTAYIDVEHTLDPTWATVNGANVADMLVSQPDSGEQALDITDTLIESGLFGVIVVDSVAALTPKAELDGEVGDATVGAQARLMSRFMRRIVAKVDKTNTSMIFVNQVRANIGNTYNPTTTTGGKALQFYAAVRLEVSRTKTNKGKNDEAISNQVKIKAVKNKMSAPYKEAEFTLKFDTGFDKVGSLVDVAVLVDIIKKSGAWFEYEGLRWQGQDQVVTALKNDSELYAQVYTAVQKVQNTTK